VRLNISLTPKLINGKSYLKIGKKSCGILSPKNLGIKDSNLRWREHDDKERSFYSKKTVDLEYNFPFGFKELWGLAYRTNYDLLKHTEFF